MRRKAFKMKLKPGFEAEYKKRHDEIWPDLKKLLSDAGIQEYSIFLDEDTSTLFAIQKLPEDFNGDHIADQPIMRKWWNYMADIMDTNPDNSPVVTDLNEVFYME